MIATPFRKGREHDHSDGTVDSILALVPGNNNEPVVLVGSGVQNNRHVLREPIVALLDRVAGRRAGIVHVATHVRRDEVVVRDRVAREIGSQLAQRSHHARAGRTR